MRGLIAERDGQTQRADEAVCMHVCMCIGMFVCMYSQRQTDRQDLSKRLPAIHACVCVCVCVRVCMHMCTRAWYMHRRTDICVYISTVYIQICVYT